MESGLVNKIILSAAVAVMSVLCACSGEEMDEYAETTLAVGKRGEISERIIESFDKDYYDLGELQSEFESSVSEYNGSIGGDEIKLGKIELNGTTLTVDLKYTGPSDYENFTGERLFVGTIADACDEGYSMDVTLKGVESGDKIGRVQIMGMINSNIIILSEHVRVKAFDDIAYVSANVDVIGDSEARVLSESDGLAYIILK